MSSMDQDYAIKAAMWAVVLIFIAMCQLWSSSDSDDSKKYAKFKYHTFTAADLALDEKTKRWENVILDGVNRAHREVDGCRSIDPLSAYISKDRSTQSGPVFYVTCGRPGEKFKFYFDDEYSYSWSGVEK